VAAAGGAAILLRVSVSETFRPLARADRRRLGIETAPAPFLRRVP
jgi:hypothetical protein